MDTDLVIGVMTSKRWASPLPVPVTGALQPADAQRGCPVCQLRFYSAKLSGGPVYIPAKWLISYKKS